ncbi:universal stress protein [Streptomyces bottropensis]|uniref:universal stress protein n=1 Tax=Streptomyces bottropensis TaxID=42235 RepID=UPI0036A6F980
MDARDPPDAAIGFAFEAALLRDVRLHAVHAWRLPSFAIELPFGVSAEDRAAWEDHEVQLLADALRPWRARHPEVRALEDVVLFAPEHALILRSASAALVAAGQRAGSRVGSRAGSVTRALLRDSACPVAVVPG